MSTTSGYTSNDVNDKSDDNSPLDVTVSNLKWEDSGIVFVSGQLTPEDETKHVQGTESNQFNRRRSSAETYSFSSDGQQECNGGGAWLSDADDAATRDQHDVSRPETVDVIVSENGADRPSVGSSPAQDDSSPEQESVPTRPMPRVEFKKGVRCHDVVRALEILKTAYKLPDVTFCHYYSQWSSWSISNYCGPSFTRREEDAIPHCRELKDMCLGIERRNRDISEILRKLLELDAANRAEAEAFGLQSAGTQPDELASSETSSPFIRPGDFSQQQAGDIVPAEDEAHDDGAATNQSRPLKRRNPFSRAVHALRKRLARPSQNGVPAAA